MHSANFLWQQHVFNRDQHLASRHQQNIGDKKEELPAKSKALLPLNPAIALARPQCNMREHLCFNTLNRCGIRVKPLCTLLVARVQVPAQPLLTSESRGLALRIAGGQQQSKHFYESSASCSGACQEEMLQENSQGSTQQSYGDEVGKLHAPYRGQHGAL